MAVEALELIKAGELLRRADLGIGPVFAEEGGFCPTLIGSENRPPPLESLGPLNFFAGPGT